MKPIPRSSATVTRQNPVERRLSASDVLELATRLTLSDDEIEVCEMVAEFALDHFKVARVSVGLLRPDDPSLMEIVALAGYSGELPRGVYLNVNELVVGQALQAGRPLSYDPTTRSERDAVATAKMGMNWCLVLPLLSGTRRFGSLNLGTTEPDIDADIVFQLGRLLGSQLDRIATSCQLTDQLASQQKESRRWDLLRGLEKWAVTTNSVDDLMAHVSMIVDELVPGARLTFVEMSTGAVMVWPTGAGHTDTVIELADPNHGMLLARLGTEMAHYIKDLGAESQGAFPPEILPDNARSALCVAVHGRTGPLGAIVVGAMEVDGIGSREQEMLHAIAPLVGGALERIEVDKRLIKAASHDQLTGLIRRAGFDSLLESEVAAIQRTDDTNLVHAVAAIDVDRFKVVNDTQGHLRGDDFLVELVARFRRVLEPQDVATRVGADEFLILLRGRERDEYENVCARLVTTVNELPFIVGGHPVAGTISLGFALVDKATASGREAVSMADAACYSSKMLGGNRVREANTLDSRQSARRTASQSLLALRRAIEDDSLLLHGQPIYEFENDELSGFEVLVRMRAPDGTLIAPAHFLPIAERFHATEEIDAWVVRRALWRLSRCAPESGQPPRMFINVSPSSITSAGFAERIEEIVDDSGVSPDRLCFEVTETGTMKSFDEAVRFVERMKSFGSLVALDDFGVGLSSLSHLHRLPVDVLKIDGSLVKGIEHSSVNSKMVSTIQALAESLGKVTIAEFVENERAAAMLHEVGVHCGQGYHFGKPSALCEQLSAVGFGLPEANPSPDQDDASIEH